MWLGQKTDLLKSPAHLIVATVEQTRIAAVRRMGKHIVFDLDRVTRAPANGRSSKRKFKATTTAPSTFQAVSDISVPPTNRKKQTSKGRRGGESTTTIYCPAARLSKR